jgi:hypothetical protein
MLATILIAILLIGPAIAHAYFILDLATNSGAFFARIDIHRRKQEMYRDFIGELVLLVASNAFVWFFFRSMAPLQIFFYILGGIDVSLLLRIIYRLEVIFLIRRKLKHMEEIAAKE